MTDFLFAFLTYEIMHVCTCTHVDQCLLNGLLKFFSIMAYHSERCKVNYCTYLRYESIIGLHMPLLKR